MSPLWHSCIFNLSQSRRGKLSLQAFCKLSTHLVSEFSGLRSTGWGAQETKEVEILRQEPSNESEETRCERAKWGYTAAYRVAHQKNPLERKR
jgi:hypothetical protein